METKSTILDPGDQILTTVLPVLPMDLLWLLAANLHLTVYLFVLVQYPFHG